MGSGILCGMGAVVRDESDYDKQVLADDRKFGSYGPALPTSISTKLDAFGLAVVG